MTAFTQYDETGRILFSGDVPEDLIAQQGDRVILGKWDPATHYVLNGQAVERPASEVVQAQNQKADVMLLRQLHYPPLEDLADAIYWASQGDPTKMEAYLTAVAKVKETYPKVE